MSIQIIDGFKLNLSSPIDDRIVASGSTARDNISYKYLGLRVFDLYDNIPYVWRNGTSGLKWYKENESALSILPNITFSDSNNSQTLTTKTQFPKLSGANNVTNSILEETVFKSNGSKVITIGLEPAAFPPNDTYKLLVNGNVSATSFIGIGTGLTQLNGGNISPTSINVDKISPGGDNDVLVTKGGVVVWENKNAISGSSQTPFESNSTEDHFIPFKMNASGDLKINNNFKYNPNTKQLLLSNTNDKLNPSISFIGESNSGIYRRSGNDIGISINGADKVSIDTNGVKILPGTKTNPGISFIGSNTSGFYYSSGDKKIGVSINANDVLNIVRYDSGSIVLNLNTTSNIPIPLADTYYILGNKLNITSNSFNIRTNNTSEFGLNVENTSSDGRGLIIKNKNGESLRLVGYNTNNYISFYDGTTRTAWIGHYTTAGGNNSLNLVHDSTTGKILFRIGGSVKMEINGSGISTPNSTTMKSIYHGWFFCTYNTGGAGITSNNLYGSGMNLSGFSYMSGAASGGNSPRGHILLKTPAFTNLDKVIVQITPRYSGVEQYMIFTPQMEVQNNGTNTIKIHFNTPTSNNGWAINSLAFNISIFEIVT